MQTTASYEASNDPQYYQPISLLEKNSSQSRPKERQIQTYKRASADYTNNKLEASPLSSDNENEEHSMRIHNLKNVFAQKPHEVPETSYGQDPLKF